MMLCDVESRTIHYDFGTTFIELLRFNFELENEGEDVEYCIPLKEDNHESLQGRTEEI